MTRPELNQADHPRGYKIWTARWYDEQGERRRKNFGKVGEVTEKMAKARFQDWIAHEWVAKEHVRNPSGDMATYTVNLFANAYEKEAETIYRKNGKVTSHIFQVRLAMQAFRDLYGAEPLSAVGAPEIAKVRDS